MENMKYRCIKDRTYLNIGTVVQLTKEQEYTLQMVYATEELIL